MHKAKHQLHIRHANGLHVFNNIVSAIDPLLTKPVLTIMYESTKTRQRQFQMYGNNTVKFIFNIAVQMSTAGIFWLRTVICV